MNKRTVAKVGPPLAEIKSPTQRRSWHRDRVPGVSLGKYVPMIVIYTAGAGGLLFALSVVNGWGAAQLGTVSSWVSAVGSVATCVGVAVAVMTFRHQRRDQADQRLEELEEKANQARLVVAYHPTLHNESDETGRFIVRLRLKNKSDRPVFNVAIHGLHFVVAEGSEPVRMRSTAKTQLGQQVLWLGSPARVSELEPGGEFVTLWKAHDGGKLVAGVDLVRYSLTDANGRTWIIDDNNEPRRLPRPRRQA